MAFDKIVSPNPTPEAPDETAFETALSEKPSALEEIKAATQEGFIGRHLGGAPKQPYPPSDITSELLSTPESERPSYQVPENKDIVADFRNSWDSEKKRKAALASQYVTLEGEFAPLPVASPLTDANLPARSSRPLLSPEQVQDRYSFPGLDGKPVKLTNEPVPDDVAQELRARKIEQTRRQSVIARWQNAHHWETPLGQMPSAYGFAVDLISPDTAALSLVPGIGEEAILSRLGSGFLAKTTAKAISGASTFAAGTGAMIALDKVLPDWRGDTSDLTLREAMNELYASAATGAIMHAAINPVIGAAWREGKRITLGRPGRAPTATEAPGAPQAPAEKDIGSLAEEISKIEASDGLTRRKAMATATGQVLDGKPVEVRPHFDPETSEDVLQDQQRQDRDGYAPGINPATLSEETARIYLPEEPEPGEFVKDMGGPVMSPSEMWAAKAAERGKLVRDVALLEEAQKRWTEGGATSEFPQGSLLADSLTRLRELDREVEELRKRAAPLALPAPEPGALTKAARTPAFADITPLIPRDANGDTDFEGFQRFLVEIFGKTSWSQLNGEEMRALPGLLMREGLRRPLLPPPLEGPQQPSPAGFTTAKGSTYQVHEDGTTTRNKSDHSQVGHEASDVGLKPRSEKTVYIDDAAMASALSAAGVTAPEGTQWRVVLKDGKATLISRQGDKPWGAAPSSRDIPFSTEPGVGKAPLELWKPKNDVPGYEAYGGMHAGNAIVSVEHGVQTEAPAAARPEQRVLTGEILGPEPRGPREQMTGDVLARGELPPGPVTDAIRERDAQAAGLDEWLKYQDEYPEEEAQRLYRRKMAEIDNAFEDALARHEAESERPDVMYAPSGQRGAIGNPRHPMVELIQWRDREAAELERWLTRDSDYLEPDEAQAYYRAKLAQIDHTFHEEALKYQQAGSAKAYRALKRQEAQERAAKLKGKSDLSLLPSGASWGDIIGRLREQESSLPEWLKALPDDWLKRRTHEEEPALNRAYDQFSLEDETFDKFKARMGIEPGETFSGWAQRTVAEKEEPPKRRDMRLQDEAAQANRELRERGPIIQGDNRTQQWFETEGGKAKLRAAWDRALREQPVSFGDMPPEERAEAPAAVAEPAATEAVPGRRSYMATPEDITSMRQTPAEMAREQGITEEQAARRQAIQVARHGMGPTEEKPLIQTPEVEARQEPVPEAQETGRAFLPEETGSGRRTSDNAHLRERRASDIDYISDKVRRTGFYRVSEAHRQETFRIADQRVREIAPSGVKVFVIQGIKLDNNGKPWVLYETSNGERDAFPASLAGPAKAFAFVEPSSKSIFLNRVTALGDSDHLLRGIVEHEIGHLARLYGNFAPGEVLNNSWRRILAHANRFSVLDLTIGDYADLIGDPLPGSHTLTYRSVFDKLYREGTGKQEKFDQESVNLAIQLYSAMKARRDPALPFFDPIKRDIEAFLSGEYQNRTLMHVPTLGNEDLLYARASGPEGNPRGVSESFLREPRWPLSADIIEASKADFLRNEFGKMSNIEDYAFAVRSLQENRAVPAREREYLEELKKYTIGEVPWRPNVVMVGTYYKLTGRKLNDAIPIRDFYEAYLKDAQKIEGTKAANNKAGREFYVKSEEQFRSHLERFGREDDAAISAGIPSKPKAWLINKDADTVSLSPYVAPAYAERMFAPTGSEGSFKPAPDQMEDFANRATRYFLSKGAGEITPLLKSYQQELDAFGRKTTAQDAIAFFKAYFTQPSAALSLAPGFTRAIQQLFDRIDPDTHSSFMAHAAEYEAGMQSAAGEPSDASGLSAETAAELAKYETILKTFDAKALLPEELGELKQTAEDLATAKTADQKEAAARRRTDAIVNAIARKDVMDEVRQNGGIANAKWSLRSILHGTNSGSRLSIEAVWNGLRSGWLGILDNEVRKAGLRKMAVSGSMDRETSREIWKMNAAQSMGVAPITEGSPARRLAEILWPLMRNAKDRMNQAGARIGDALDYVLSTYHDPYKLRAAAGNMRDDIGQAFQAWWKFVLPRINQAKTFADLVPGEGETIEQARVAFGRSVFNALVTGVHLTYRGEEAHPQESGGYTAPAFEGSFNLARKVSQQRVLFWKDADSWMDYHQRFGPANSLTHAVINSLERSSRNVALMERLGTNPTANLNLIIRKIEEEYRNADPDAVARFRRRDVSGLQDVMAHLDGSVNMPANEMWAALNSSYRTWFSASALGGVGLTHFASVWPTVPSELVHHGISRVQSLQMMTERLASSLGGRGSEERQAMLSELGAFADGTIRAMHRKWLPTGQDTVPGRISAIAARLLEYSGIHHIFDTVQAGVRETLAQNLARNFDKEFAGLEPHLRQMIGKYGIGEDEWNMLRQLPGTMADGRRYLTPRDVHQISDEALDGYTKAKIDAFKAKIEERRQQFEAADAREQEWHQSRTKNLNEKITSLRDWVSKKTETRDAAFKKRLLLRLAQVDELKNRVDTIEAVTDLMQGLKGLGVQDKVQQFLEDVEGGAESWKAAKAAGRVMESGARSHLSAGERLGEQRAKIQAQTKDILSNLGGDVADAKAKADVEWLDNRTEELRQAVEESNYRMNERISSRAERLREMQDEYFPAYIDELRRDTRNNLSNSLLAYYTDAAKHAVIGGGIRERAAALGQARPGTFSGEMLRHVMLYKMWPLAQIYQGLGREYYMSLSRQERIWNIGVLAGLSMLGGFMRMAVADAVTGNPQRDPFDPKTMAAALAQGGGLGIFGDYLFGEIGRSQANPLETVMGPAASDVGALMHILYRWRDEALDESGHRTGTGFGDLAHFGVRHIPFGNLIYLRGAANYMLWQHLYEAIDPGYWERMNRRILKERGRTAMGYSPGAGVPFGVPPLYLRYPSGRATGLLAGH